MPSNPALTERLDFMRLDEAGLGHIRNVKAIVMQALPAILDDFYAQIEKFTEPRKLFANSSQIAGARGKQLGHWEMISSGELDDGYVKAVSAVGHVHARIGLEPRWYIGGYALVLEGLIGRIVEARWPQASRDEAGKAGIGKVWRRFRSRTSDDAPGQAKALSAEIGAIVKATLLDMDFAISVYLEAAEAARLRAEKDVLTRERAAVVASVGEAMAALARGDVTYRMPDNLPGEYSQLRDDFNAAAAKMHDTMKTVLSATRDISGSVDTVTQVATDLARRTEEQAASLEESAATTEELAASVKMNAQSSRLAEGAARDAMGVAAHGGEIARDAVAAMGRIEEASRQIAEISSVIDGIAFQTNLLALNAAVESARAGEAGRGFAVVASEVRSLAQRSGEASRTIKTLILSSTEEVATGVALVRSAGAALEKIVAASKDVAENVSGISTASSEQANGVEELSQILAGMDGATQQNAALADESAATVASLANQVGRLEALIAGFKVGEGEMPHARTGAVLRALRLSA
jgi:methyl-accepting chemotaxis protein